MLKPSSEIVKIQSEFNTEDLLDSFTHLTDDKALIIVKKPPKEVDTKPKKEKVKLQVKYTCIGKYGMNKQDFLLQLMNLNTNGKFVFELLYNTYDYNTGICYIDSLTNTQKVKFSKGYKELNTLGIVKRIKRKHYLINPNCIINFNLYNTLIDKWNNL